MAESHNVKSLTEHYLLKNVEEKVTVTGKKETLHPNEETEESVEQETVDDETLEIKLETAPGDYRFPTTNQSRHCFTRYVEYHRCVAAKGDGASECDKFAKYYRSLCPGEWTDGTNKGRTALFQALCRIIRCCHFYSYVPVDEALSHPYLAPLHEINEEPVCPRPFSFDFEQPSCTEEHIKELIWRESVKFNPDHTN